MFSSWSCWNWFLVEFVTCQTFGKILLENQLTAGFKNFTANSEKILTDLSSKMVSLLTAISWLFLRNCTKTIKQTFLDTDKVQLKTIACYLWQIWKNSDILHWKNFIYYVIQKVYYRRPRGPQKCGARSNCYICYYSIVKIRHWPRAK